MALAALLFWSGCSDGGQSQSFVAPDEVDGREVLLRYGGAALEGDFDAANQLRCPHYRIEPTQADSFEEQVAILQDMVGPIEVIDAERAPSKPLFSDEKTLEYRLIGSVGSDDRRDLGLVGSVTTDKGRPCVSSIWPEGAVEIVEGLPNPIEDIGDGGGDIERWLPESIGAGYELVPETADSGSGRISDQALDSVTRAWRTDDFGGVRVSALRFANVDAARDAAEESLTGSLDYIVERLETPELAEAIAYTYLSMGWTGVQPAEHGPVTHQAVILAGSTLIVVSESVSDQDQEPQALTAVLQHVARL